jgi:hypothetical protein
MNLTKLVDKNAFSQLWSLIIWGCWHEVMKSSGLFPGLLGWLSCLIEVFVFELWFGQQSIPGSKRFGLEIWYCRWKFFVLDFMEWSLWTKRLGEVWLCLVSQVHCNGNVKWLSNYHVLPAYEIQVCFFFSIVHCLQRLGLHLEVWSSYLLKIQCNIVLLPCFLYASESVL